MPEKKQGKEGDNFRFTKQRKISFFFAILFAMHSVIPPSSAPKRKAAAPNVKQHTTLLTTFLSLSLSVH